MHKTSEQIEAEFRNALRPAMKVSTPWVFQQHIENALGMMAQYGLEKAPFQPSFTINHAGASWQRGAPNLENLRDLLDDCQSLTQDWNELDVKGRSKEMRDLRSIVEPELA